MTHKDLDHGRPDSIKKTLTSFSNTLSSMYG